MYDEGEDCVMLVTHTTLQKKTDETSIKGRDAVSQVTTTKGLRHLEPLELKINFIKRLRPNTGCCWHTA
jgi:hypothetical protein